MQATQAVSSTASVASRVTLRLISETRNMAKRVVEFDGGTKKIYVSSWQNARCDCIRSRSIQLGFQFAGYSIFGGRRPRKNYLSGR